MHAAKLTVLCWRRCVACSKAGLEAERESTTKTESKWEQITSALAYSVLLAQYASCAVVVPSQSQSVRAATSKEHFSHLVSCQLLRTNIGSVPRIQYCGAHTLHIAGYMDL